MPSAYIAVHTASGTSPEVLAAVREIEEVAEAHVVAGNYDLIIELEARSAGHLDYADSPVTEQLLPIVTKEIQGIEGVGATRTYIVLD
jgi:DNA-binding Lrp family transcriptional regulator